MIQELGRIIVTFGVILVLLGATLQFFGKIPFFGKLPGDILVKRENFSFYAPITSALLISIILSVIFTIISNIKR